MYAQLRTLRLADGPDEVHKRTITRYELRKDGAPRAPREEDDRTTAALV
jgi:acyl-CoA dehydrogenase